MVFRFSTEIKSCALGEKYILLCIFLSFYCDKIGFGLSKVDLDGALPPTPQRRPFLNHRKYENKNFKTNFYHDICLYLPFSRLELKDIAYQMMFLHYKVWYFGFLNLKNIDHFWQFLHNFFSSFFSLKNPFWGK